MAVVTDTMWGVSAAIFVVVAFSAVLLGVVIGPIPTHPSDTIVTLVPYTSDTHDISVAALSSETNATFIPSTTQGATLTLADGTYDGQQKTLVAAVPNDIFVETTWGTLRLESDVSAGEHAVTLMWSEEFNRWEHLASSHSAPTWHPKPNRNTTFTVYNGVAISGNGRILAGGADPNIDIIIYDEATDTYKINQTITTALSTSAFGHPMKMSADGRVIITGVNDLTIDGGAVFIRADSPGGTYVEHAPVVPIDGTGSGSGGYVAISADGNVAFIGGPFDDTNAGAVWVFDYNEAGDNYTERGTKIVPTDLIGVGPNRFGIGLSCSADGKTFVVTGIRTPSTDVGVWVFRENPTTRVFEQTTATYFVPTDLTPTGGFLLTAMAADGNSFMLTNPNADELWIMANSASDRDTYTQTSDVIDFTSGGGGGTAGRSISMSSDGRTIAMNSDGDTLSWVQVDASSGKPVVGDELWTPHSDDFPGFEHPNRVAISGDGRTVFHATTNGGVILR